MNIPILSAYTIYHAVLILVPVIFIGIYSIIYGIRSPVLVLAIGAAGAGLLSYCISWVSLASTLTGMILVFCLYILIIYSDIKKLQRGYRDSTAANKNDAGHIIYSKHHIIYFFSFNRHLAIFMATLHMYAIYIIYLSYSLSPVSLTSDSSLKYQAFICFAICMAILGVTAKNDFKSKLTRITNN